MRARARCHTCSRFIPFPLSLTKILLFPIRRRAACRRRRSIALFTVCRYAHVDKRTQSPHRNAIDFWPLSLFPLFPHLPCFKLSTVDLSTTDLTTNRRETRASSIYRPRHLSFLYFLVLVSWSSHDTIECFVERHCRPLLKLPCTLTERSPCNDLHGSSSAQHQGSLFSLAVARASLIAYL